MNTVATREGCRPVTCLIFRARILCSVGEKRSKQNLYAVSSVLFLALGVITLCALFFALSTPIVARVASNLETDVPSTGELAEYDCGYFGYLVLHGGQVEIMGDPPAEFTATLQNACNEEQKAPAVTSAILASFTVIFLVAAGVARHRGIANNPRARD